MNRRMAAVLLLLVGEAAAASKKFACVKFPDDHSDTHLRGKLGYTITALGPN